MKDNPTWWHRKLKSYELEQIFIWAVLCYLILQSAYPLLEKRYYWGEFFALGCACFLFRFPFREKGYDKHLIFLVLIWMLLFPVYGILISRLFWHNVFESIFLIRHAPFFYYSIFFFFAYKYAETTVKYMAKLALPTIALLVPLTFQSYLAGMPGLNGLLLLGINERYPEKKKYYHWAFFFIFLTLLRGMGGGTGKVLIGFFVSFFLLYLIGPYYRCFVPKMLRISFTYILVLLLIGFFLWLMERFGDMTTQMALMGDNITSMDTMTEDFHTDTNGFWRPTLWSHLYGRFLKHPWGIGLGTPLFEYWLDGFVMLHLYKPGENYIQGAHNSFVTFMARMGIPAVCLFSLLFYWIAKLANRVFANPHFDLFQSYQGRKLTASFIGFFSMVILSSFNVMLESPLYAALFWFNFGLFTRLFGDAAAEARKNELDETQGCHIETTA